MKTVGVASIAALVLFGQASAGPIDDARAAMRRADFAAELALVRPLAERGDPVAQEMLGELYESGIAVKLDYARALAWYQKASDQGNAQAETRLGFMYQFGKGLPRDTAKAVLHFRKGAERGDHVAQSRMATAYELGDGVAQDDAQADFWLRKAASQGDEGAVFRLRHIWDVNPGQYRPKDYAMADLRARRTAEAGAPYAQYILGVRYRDGLGTQRDPAKAREWLSKAASQNYGPAQFELGVMAPDTSQAAEWFYKAARNKVNFAQGRLDLIYELGTGAPRDQKEAASWYRKGAEAFGNAWAQFRLGSIYEEGRSVGKDSAVAATWYSKAAEQGLPDAQIKLGGMYEEGRGVRRNLVQAYQWFAIAQSLTSKVDDDGEAERGRDRVGAKLSRSQIEVAKRSVDAWTKSHSDPVATR